jgi:hypothetical protein
MEQPAGYLEWPTRFPVWRTVSLLAGIAVTLGFVSAWLTVRVSPLERVYFRAYVRSTVKANIPKLPHRKDLAPRVEPLHLIVLSAGKFAIPATFRSPVSVTRIRLSDARFVALLKSAVFGGRGAFGVIRWPLIAGALLTLVFFVLGTRRDINLRRQAAVGIHRRGTRMVSGEEFNRRVGA